jgi:CheY-like chemotaxis protein
MFSFGKQQPSPTLLLIDDDLVSREVMATVLTMSGYAVHTAEGGAPALKLLEDGECAPDAILMDAQMPGLNGAGLIEELRLRSRARVFAMSGSHAPRQLLAAADGFLLKPFGADELRALLEKHDAPEASAGGAGGGAARPESVSPSGDPVVSAATLAQLRGLMPESSVKEIYLAVVTDLAARLEALEVAIVCGDAAQIRRIGHAIKGGCGMAGAIEAARLGALLEASIPSHQSKPASAPGMDNLDDTSRLLTELHDAARNLKRMLDAEFPA